MILQAQNLAVARGDRILFQDLNFSLAAGEALHVQGRNGAGKTSLLEVLTGLRQPEMGEVTRLEPEQFHWLGHRNGLNLALSPQENLQFWCGLHGVDAARVPSALERAGLNKASLRACGRLSTGQRRRAALARLTVSPRQCWLLDEPLAGLDFEGCSLFERWLAEHLSGGGAIVFSSHQTLQQATRSLRLGA